MRFPALLFVDIRSRLFLHRDLFIAGFATCLNTAAPLWGQASWQTSRTTFYTTGANNVEVGGSGLDDMITLSPKRAGHIRAGYLSDGGSAVEQTRYRTHLEEQ